VDDCLDSKDIRPHHFHGVWINLHRQRALSFASHQQREISMNMRIASLNDITLKYTEQDTRSNADQLTMDNSISHGTLHGQEHGNILMDGSLLVFCYFLRRHGYSLALSLRDIKHQVLQYDRYLSQLIIGSKSRRLVKISIL
jgi:hypothetical protein